MLVLFPLLSLLLPFNAWGNSQHSDIYIHDESHYKKLFAAWCDEYDTKFQDELEYQIRLDVFARNHDFIEIHNVAANNGMKSFTLGHNEFSHLTWNEFKDTHLSWRPKMNLVGENQVENSISSSYALKSIDWVQRGAVTSVKNQGMCGSCWAFSATGAMEGALFVSSGKLVDLSVEQMIDCDKVNFGCFGGEMTDAYDWVKEAGGMCASKDYEYTGMLPIFKRCLNNCEMVEGTEVSGWATVEPSEEKLMGAVMHRPIAIAIEAGQREFQFYKNGVFDASCGSDLDHGVLLVGYGAMDGKEYWKVKNSWGDTWGANGYIYLKRGGIDGDNIGQCGILMEATYPILSSETHNTEFDKKNLQTLFNSLKLVWENNTKVIGNLDGISAVANEYQKNALDSLFERLKKLFERSAYQSKDQKYKLQNLFDEMDILLKDSTNTIRYNILELSIENIVYILESSDLTGSISAADCGGGSIAFNSFEFSTEDPSRGKPISVIAAGTSSKKFTDGSYMLTVERSGTTLYSHEGPLCGESEASLPLGLGKVELSGFDCPMEPGEVAFSMKVTLPVIAPSGRYNINMKGNDQNGNELMCMQADLTI